MKKRIYKLKFLGLFGILYFVNVGDEKWVVLLINSKCFLGYWIWLFE